MKSVPRSIMTLNAYCFPKIYTSMLKLLGMRNLQEAVALSIDYRIKALGSFVIQQAPDIVCFQELWADDNKKAMMDVLRHHYPYHFYVPHSKIDQAYAWGETIKKWAFALYSNLAKKWTWQWLYQLNPFKIDNGLLIASRLPFEYTYAFAYDDRMGDELHAIKGALWVYVRDEEGKNFIMVNTHLQAGDSLQAHLVRNKQIRQLGRELNNLQTRHSKHKDSSLIIVGDFNEPIAYSKEQSLLIDGTDYLVRALADEGIIVNNQVTHSLAHTLGVQEIVPLYQPATHILDYFEHASELMLGTTLVDHCFIDATSTMVGYKVFRKEIMANEGDGYSYNPRKALSDHAAVMVKVEV